MSKVTIFGMIGALLPNVSEKLVSVELSMMITEEFLQKNSEMINQIKDSKFLVLAEKVTTALEAFLNSPTAATKFTALTRVQNLLEECYIALLRMPITLYRGEVSFQIAAIYALFDLNDQRDEWLLKSFLDFSDFANTTFAVVSPAKKKWLSILFKNGQTAFAFPVLPWVLSTLASSLSDLAGTVTFWFVYIASVTSGVFASIKLTEIEAVEHQLELQQQAVLSSEEVKQVIAFSGNTDESSAE